MVDDRIVVPKSLRYAALNALHFGHPGNKKNVQWRGHILVAEHAGRHREEIKNLLAQRW